MAKPKRSAKGRVKPGLREESFIEDTAGPSPAQGLPDKAIFDFYDHSVQAFDEMQALQEKVSKARGKYRAILKDAKKAGMEPDDIVWRIKARDREIEDIDRETAARNRLARVTKLPIGTQLGLFEDGQTVAQKISMDAGVGSTKADQKKLAEQAGADGFKAGKAGKSQLVNPWPLKSPAFERWNEQWLEGQKENIGGLKDVTEAASKSRKHLDA